MQAVFRYKSKYKKVGILPIYRKLSLMFLRQACRYNLGMCRVPLYQIVIHRIPDSSKFKHESQRMKWEYHCQCSLQLKFKQNISIDLNKTVTSLVYCNKSATNEGAAHHTGQTRLKFSFKLSLHQFHQSPVKLYWIVEFYRYPVHPQVEHGHSYCKIASNYINCHL